MLFEKRALPSPAFALWRALYGAYLRFVLPLGIRMRSRSATSPASLRTSCCRACEGRTPTSSGPTASRPPRSTVFRKAGRPGAPGALRVAHLVATSGQTGVESHLRVLFEGLRALGHDPFLVCPEPGHLTETLEARGFEVRIAAPRRRMGHLALRRTARAIAGADLVHAHGPRAIWWSAAMLPWSRTRTAVATVHQIDQSGVDSMWRRRSIARFERRALRAHARVIAVSSGLREQVLRATGLAPDVVQRVPASAPLAARAAAPDPAVTDPPRVVVVARFSREKGIDVLLDAWADPRLAAQAVVLHVVGDGPERAALEARARALGGRVVFRGWRTDSLAEIEGALAYVAPSRVETFGIAVLEAMALGVPVVATDVAGHRDLFGEEYAGELVAPEQPLALADALTLFLARPATERAELGKNLQRRAHAEFSPRRMAEGTARVYAEARASVRTGSERAGGSRSTNRLKLDRRG
jgi:glycosyltransferase involved in cell wall biosynthesis